MASKKATEAALKKFEQRFAKVFGENTLKRSAEINPYEVISTGSLTLDYRLTVGGYVEGRLVEIWGPDGVGKTTLSIFGMREAQKKYPDKMVAFIDVEQKFDKAWAAAHGVDLTRLYLYEPDSAEDVADALKEMCQSGLFSMVVLDSIGAMIPEVEREKDAGDAVVGTTAKLITRMVKLNAVEASRSGTTVLMINQVRANIGYGADTTTGGGWALKHSTTMKFKLRRTGTPPYKAKVGGEERTVGQEIAIYVERNGVAPAYRTAIVNLFTVPTEKYGPIGIDQSAEAATLGVDTGVIKQAGAWYTVPGGQRFQGREALVDYLRTDPEMRTAIRNAILASVAGDIQGEESDEDEITVAEEGGGPDFRRGAPEGVE